MINFILIQEILLVNTVLFYLIYILFYFILFEIMNFLFSIINIKKFFYFKILIYLLVFFF